MKILELFIPHLFCLHKVFLRGLQRGEHVFIQKVKGQKSYNLLNFEDLTNSGLQCLVSQLPPLAVLG